MWSVCLCVCGWGGGLVGGKHVCMSGECIFPAPLSRHLHSAGRSAEPRAVGASLPLYTSVPLLFQQHHNTLWQLSSWRINMDSLPPPPDSSPKPHRTPCCSPVFETLIWQTVQPRVSSLGLVLTGYPSLPASPRSAPLPRRSLCVGYFNGCFCRERRCLQRRSLCLPKTVDRNSWFCCACGRREQQIRTKTETNENECIIIFHCIIDRAH